MNLQGTKLCQYQEEIITYTIATVQQVNGKEGIEKLRYSTISFQRGLSICKTSTWGLEYTYKSIMMGNQESIPVHECQLEGLSQKAYSHVPRLLPCFPTPAHTWYIHQKMDHIAYKLG